MYIHLLCQQKNRPSGEASLQSWGSAKLFWGWQTLPSLFLVPFFDQRFAVWITPCTPPLFIHTVSSLKLYPDTVQSYSPFTKWPPALLQAIISLTGEYHHQPSFSKEQHKESIANISKWLLVLHTSVSGLSITDLLGALFHTFSGHPRQQSLPNGSKLHKRLLKRAGCALADDNGCHKILACLDQGHRVSKCQV